ncbi:DUF1491 family protein [Pannonibacter sp. Pt2-lr]
MRQVFTAGGFAATTRKGAEEAGVVFVLVDRMDGTVDLYGPAPRAPWIRRPMTGLSNC